MSSSAVEACRTAATNQVALAPRSLGWREGLLKSKLSETRELGGLGDDGPSWVCAKANSNQSVVREVAPSGADWLASVSCKLKYRGYEISVAPNGSGWRVEARPLTPDRPILSRSPFFAPVSSEEDALLVAKRKVDTLQAEY